MRIIEQTKRTSKIKDNIDVAIISDLCIHQNNIDKINEMIFQLEGIKPNMIFIPVEISPYENLTNYKSNKNLITEVINKLSSIAITYVSYNIVKLEKYRFYDNLYPEMARRSVYDNFENINTKYENNKVSHISIGPTIESDEISVTSLSPDYLFKYPNKDNIFYDIDMHNAYIKDVKNDLDENKFNILLIHNLNVITNIEKLKGLNNFDLVLTDHNHGGISKREYDKLIPIFKEYEIEDIAIGKIKNLEREEGLEYFLKHDQKFKEALKFKRLETGNIELVKLKNLK